MDVSKNGVQPRPLLGELVVRADGTAQPLTDPTELARGDYAILELWTAPWQRALTLDEPPPPDEPLIM